MEKFKAVEKEMKTKAFSKEGLNAPGKRDPKEQEKEEMGQFLSDMIGELERQIETLEAEEEQLQATAKKGKKDASKTDRLQEISRKNETHRFHIGKLELLRRSLENGNVESEKVQEKKEEIEYYVNENMSIDFMEEGTDEVYNDLNLEDDEGAYGLGNDNDRISSQDAQSTADDMPEGTEKATVGAGKQKSSSVSEPQGGGTRRPSNAFKSPLPALATLHTPIPTAATHTVKEAMKPAPLPTRPPGETLKYASAAAAAATASDKTAVGIAPLPPPPSTAPPPPTPAAALTTSSLPNAPPGLPVQSQPSKANPAASPKPLPSQPSNLNSTAVPSQVQTASSQELENALNKTKSATTTPGINAKANQASFQDASHGSEHIESSRSVSGASKAPPNPAANAERSTPAPSEAPTVPSQERSPVAQQINGDSSQSTEDESIYHLPPGLQDLIQSFEITKRNRPAPESPSVHRLVMASQSTRPDYLDAEKPHHYRPDIKYTTPSYYPQEPFANMDDPNLYGKVDTDTLFYIFYYRQNTYQQYMAAKALKSQSWRFHKQYQTWFQRHEEPKTITEEFEQGTYRFFDYESTW